MYYGSSATDKLARPNRRYYSADGSMEISATFAAGNTATPITTEFLTYIGGSAYTAPLVLKYDGTTYNYFYLHRDYQSSILAITNATGGVVEKRLFDPWGAVTQVQDGADNNLGVLTFFDRGYTGHEHLQSVNLINMNARLYNPTLHRFLEADNYLQDPYNTQNYNRYGYCVNNPLKYTDSTGNFIDGGVIEAIVIGAIISALAYSASSLMNHTPFTFQGAITSVVIGAFSGAATFGIGEGVLGINNFFVRSSVQSLCHGVFQGGMTAGFNGGKFWSGFAAGSISSLASSAWSGGGSSDDVYHQGISGATGLDNGAGTIAFGTLSGGAGSALTGGNFWEGAVTGLFVSGFNHAMHGGFNSKKTLDIDKLIENYPLDENGEQISSSDAYLGTGGDVGKFYEKEFLRTGEDPNACALRMSMAMNDAGYDISKSSSTYKGADGKNYYLSSTGLKNYISNNYNLTSITTTNSSLSAFAGIKGIYFMQPISPAKFQASGHITIWDGNSCLGGHCYNTHPQFYSATLFH